MLRSYREASGMTQRSLSKKLKGTRNFVYRIERGDRGVEFLEVIQVLKILGVEPEEFMNRFLDACRAEGVDPYFVQEKVRGKVKSVEEENL